MQRRLASNSPRPPPAPRRQAGLALYSAILALALFSYALVQLLPLYYRWELRTFRMATVTQINEVSQAAKTYYFFQVETDEAACLADREDCWPDDIAELIAADFIGDDAERNGFGLVIEAIPNGPTVIVSAQTPDLPQANALRMNFGGLATIDSSNPLDIRLEVEYAAPGIDSEHLALLDLDATRQVTGTVTFDLAEITARLATSTVLDLGGGDLVGADTITSNTINSGTIANSGQITSGSATVGDPANQIELSNLGNITAPSAIITTLATDDLRIQ